MSWQESKNPFPNRGHWVVDANVPEQLHKAALHAVELQGHRLELPQPALLLRVPGFVRAARWLHRRLQLREEAFGQHLVEDAGDQRPITLLA
jgi:hypothetical protein